MSFQTKALTLFLLFSCLCPVVKCVDGAGGFGRLSLVETGGRIHPESCAFIRDVATNGGSMPCDGGHATFRGITYILIRQQMYMLALMASQLAARASHAGTSRL